MLRISHEGSHVTARNSRVTFHPHKSKFRAIELKNLGDLVYNQDAVQSDSLLVVSLAFPLQTNEVCSTNAQCGTVFWQIPSQSWGAHEAPAQFNSFEWMTHHEEEQKDFHQTLSNVRLLAGQLIQAY